MTSIQSLIERLQAIDTVYYDEANDGLDTVFAEAIGWHYSYEWDQWLNLPDSRPALPQFTTSLDAIVAEIERVFPGCWWDVKRLVIGPRGYFACVHPECGDEHRATHKSAPLAACIALLRAIEARDNGETK